MSSVIPAPTAGALPAWTLADRLRKAREDAGLDQAELSRVSGISRATISAAENGHRKPSRSVISMWAMATGVSRSWLTGEDPTPDGNPAALRAELEQLRGTTLVTLIMASKIENAPGHGEADAVLDAVAQREAEVQRNGDWQSSSSIHHPEVMEWCSRHKKDLHDRIVQVENVLQLETELHPQDYKSQVSGANVVDLTAKRARKHRPANRRDSRGPKGRTA